MFSDRRSIGAVVRRLRKERGLRLKQVAERSGFVLRNVIRLESGGTLPTLETLASIAYAMNLELSELIAEIERHFKRVDDNVEIDDSCIRPLGDALLGMRDVGGVP